MVHFLRRLVFRDTLVTLEVQTPSRNNILKLISDQLYKVIALHDNLTSFCSGGSANWGRGVQPLAHEAHPKIFELPRPLPVITVAAVLIGS